MANEDAKVLELRNSLPSHDRLAVNISNKFVEWGQQRRPWTEETKEARNYIFQTSTKDTTNKKLPWKNSTTTPKLCQIRDNLHANYMAAEFSRDDFFRWEGSDENSAKQKMKTAIEAYVSTKVKGSNLQDTISDCLLDYIDEGNVFGEVRHVEESYTDPDTNEKVVTYKGPKLFRISPYDIQFDLSANEFKNAPKITKSIKQLGQLMKLKDSEELNYDPEVIEHLLFIRNTVSRYNENEVDKAQGIQIDGFGDLKSYYGTNFVEILEFEGDWFDPDSMEMQENRLITIADRSMILRNIANPSWQGRDTKRHVGWRKRPDNLWGMGPLANLVGMQYRIDHLENASADAVDLTIQPPLKIKGAVDEFEWGPFAEIFLGEDGDLETLRIETSAFANDNKIAILEAKMELFAGAPREAMGVRTPGEKTAFEVQTLNNAASRIFQNKIQHFEKHFLEPILNDYLEVGRRFLGKDFDDTVKSIDSETGAALFASVKREDIAAEGRLEPIGARHFAAKAQALQNITTFMGSTVGQDPSVLTHVSGWTMAQVFEDLLDLEKFNMVSKNIRVSENLETQRQVKVAEEQLAGEDAVGEGDAEADLAELEAQGGPPNVPQ